MLFGFCVNCPEVGYCQGMSTIAAFVLKQSRGPEDAFLLFSTMMRGYGLMDLFLPGLPVSFMMRFGDSAGRANAHSQL
jgi:hypothetical protein